MEDKRLERSVEEIAKRIVYDGPWPSEDRDGNRLPLANAALYPMQGRPFGEQVKKNLQWAIENALQAERDKLNIEVDRQTEKLCYENAALQSQITALQKERDDISSDWKELHRVGQELAINNSSLKTQLTTIKELLNGASLHPETGVSLVDDVRDLVKELARCKNSVPGSIKSYIAQVEHQKKETADLQAKFDYTAGEWKKEEVLWKEREAKAISEYRKLLDITGTEISDLQAKLSVCKEGLEKIGDNVCDNGCMEMATQALAQLQPEKERG